MMNIHTSLTGSETTGKRQKFRRQQLFSAFQSLPLGPTTQHNTTATASNLKKWGKQADARFEKKQVQGS